MRLFTILLLVCTSFGCQKRIKTPTEFYTWLNDAQNGLIKERVVDGLKFKMKYLPTEYLVLKELRGSYTEKAASHLRKQYGGGYSFLLTIEPIDSKEGELLHRDIYSVSEYLDRVNRMRFRIEDCIKLETKQGKYIPILSNFEEALGATKHKSFHIVFGGKEVLKSLEEGMEWDIIFEDSFFDTGIHHFIYDTKVIKNIPILEFWTKNDTLSHEK